MSKHKIALGTLFSFVTFGLIIMAMSLQRAHASPQQKSTQAVEGGGGNTRPGETIDDEYLEWPLAPEDKPYAAINGKHLKQYAAEIIAIRERYRDQGHQFWGTITGTSSDVETQQWVLDKFKQIGLETRTVEHQLPPQFIPKSWEVTANINGKTLQFPSAFPVNNIPGTSAEGLDLEAVYVGTGSEAEYAGRNVQGKAVFIYNNARNHANFSALNESTEWPSSSTGTDNAMLRAEHQGASAIFLIFAVPGNVKAYLYRVWPGGAHVPTFSIGLDDGLAFTKLLGSSSPGAPPHVKVRIDATPVLHLKTATILGTLPGMTDETVYVNAHRDSIFDGASDNASGLVVMMGLAEYFAKVPKTDRKRTIVFIASSGHHNDCKDDKVPCSITMDWMAEHHDELFKNTALMINLEHVANSQTYIYMGVGKSDTSQEALFWSVKGSGRLADLSYKTIHEFGVPTYSEGNNFGGGDMSGIFKYSPAAINMINLGLYSHTDGETLDDLPWTGLQAVARTYAKIITLTNKMDIKELGSSTENNSGAQ